jgi:hypothetical protein
MRNYKLSIFGKAHIGLQTINALFAHTFVGSHSVLIELIAAASMAK